jgi:antitoxin VapB
MIRVTLSLSEGTQVVPLPEEVAFPEGVRSVVVALDGVRRIITPADVFWNDFFDEPGIDLGARKQPPID